MTTRVLAVLTFAASLVSPAAHAQQSAPISPTTPPPAKADVMATMKKATTFMVEKVAHRGGYVWAYLPDLSRRWGEIEARDDEDLDPAARHADDGAPVPRRVSRHGRRVLLPGGRTGGGRADLGPAPCRRMELRRRLRRRSLAATTGTTRSARTRWRLEEFQHYYGNATFDDGGTAEASKFLLRLYVEKRDPKYRPALEKAIQFVIDSQYPIGAWPQRYPEVPESTTPAGQKSTRRITPSTTTWRARTSTSC